MALHLKTIHPVSSGVPFPDCDMSTKFRIVDGFGGGEPLEWGATAYTPVHRSHAVASRNNLLVTFGQHGVKWDAGAMTLSGTVRLPAGDPVTISIATNGMNAVEGHADPAVRIRLDRDPDTPGLVRLRVAADETKEVSWRVRFGS